MTYRILMLTIAVVGTVACQGTLDMEEEFADGNRGRPDATTNIQQTTESSSSDGTTTPPLTAPDAGTSEDATTPSPDTGPDLPTEPDMGSPDMRPEPGSVVEFRIQEGTGTGEWNTRDEPVVAYVGQILRIVNEDSRDHQLHAGDGAAVDHGGRLVPGQAEELEVERPMDLGDNPRLYDHNIGRDAAFWLEARE